jgi:hypothetical protein
MRRPCLRARSRARPRRTSGRSALRLRSARDQPRHPLPPPIAQHQTIRRGQDCPPSERPALKRQPKRSPRVFTRPRRRYGPSCQRLVEILEQPGRAGPAVPRPEAALDAGRKARGRGRGRADRAGRPRPRRRGGAPGARASAPSGRPGGLGRFLAGRAVAHALAEAGGLARLGQVAVGAGRRGAGMRHLRDERRRDATGGRSVRHSFMGLLPVSPVALRLASGAARPFVVPSGRSSGSLRRPRLRLSRR